MSIAGSKITVFAFGFALLFCLHSWVNFRQPEPYMDELFHVPQAQEFCMKAIKGGIPEYDPLITTLPGVYIPNAVLAFLIRSTHVCSTKWLRATSALAALLCLPLIARILTLLEHRSDTALSNFSSESNYQRTDERVQKARTWLISVIIWLHPVSLFYANLFYTDTLSSFWLLLAWYFSLRRRKRTSALCGSFATLTRQTNMVWHAFIFVDSCMYDVLAREKREKKSLFESLSLFLSSALQNPGHGVAFLMYIVFLLRNQGVAVGDKANHEVTLHYAMFPYFLGFHAASYFSFQILAPNRVVRELETWRQPKVLAFFMSTCFALAALVMATADRVHPFILADNRHFTFYIYRRWILRSSWHRLFLIPVYAWSLVGCFNDTNFRGGQFGPNNDEESKSRNAVRISCTERILDGFLFFCAAATLIPSGLLEPRYFSVANMILTLRRLSRNKHRVRLRNTAFMAALCAALNVMLVCIFAEFPFERPPDPHMPRDKSLGRFMF